jgi:bifunctional DNA-binding transcriptional regulator/antitoxin component of YhaV-PrlF toxin-antitoxin module
MPKLQISSKTKKEHYGTYRHDSYNVVIPYKIAESLNLQDNTILYATISEGTQTMRLHTKKPQECTTIKVRQKYTKTYRNQRYHSSRVTIPVEFARLLQLEKNDNLNISYNSNTIIIKKRLKKQD